MQNPFAAQTAPPATSPRGPSFAIKSGDTVHEGRAVNGSWVKATIHAFVGEFAKASSEIFHKEFDKIEARQDDFDRRLDHLETELGVASVKDVGSFRSTRTGTQDALR